MTRIAVVAHAGKSLGGGLSELREVLAHEGYADPLWFDVAKSSEAPKAARRAVKKGAEVVFVWGGDGTVQRCIDALAGTEAVLAILPAGTANLIAVNLEIPVDLTEAVLIGLHGERRALDTGTVNGEHFALTAGAGFDARMIKEADAGLKDRIGRLAYLYAGAKNLNASRVKATIEVDGKRYFKGPVSCVLVGNMGKIFAGLEGFDGATPDDGLLEIGVGVAKNAAQWARTLARVAVGAAEKSPFLEVTRGKKIRIQFNHRFPYEVDGGTRAAVKKLRIKVHPASIRICVPAKVATEPSAVA